MTIDEIGQGLDESGRQLIAEVLDDLKAQGLEPDARECALLRTAGELRSRMSALQALIDSDGLRLVSSTGALKLHPAASELRQHAVALTKTLQGVGMSNTTKSAQAQRAANTRWGVANG